MRDSIHRHLDRIERKLNVVLLIEGRIMADEQALDDAITALSTQQDELDAAVQSIIDKLTGVTSVDLSDEIASLQAIQGKAKDATDKITAAVTEPAPAPGDTGGTGSGTSDTGGTV